MKKTRVIYWTSTILIFLTEGLMPALTSRTELAKESIRHLGYPDYFGILLTIFKVGGSILLVIPRVTGRVKEWVYAGLAFEFIFAALSHLSVEGITGQFFLPLILFGILIISYICYHRLKNQTA